MSARPESASHAPYALPRTVIALGLTSFFADVGSDMIFPLMPAFLATLGATPLFLGLLEGAAEATASTGKLLAGRLADDPTRRKKLVLFGYGLAALARPMVAVAMSPWHILAVRLTDRVGKGIRAAPRDALISASVPAREAGRAFGVHRAMDHAGAVVGPLVAAALLAAGLSVRAVFALAAIPSVLSVLALRGVPSTEPTLTARTKAPAEREPEPSARGFRAYLAILLVFALGSSSDAFLLLRAKELGMPVGAIPLLWAAFHVVKVVSARAGGWLADRVSRPRLILAGWLVYAAGYAGFAVARAPWQAATLLVIYGASAGLVEPAEKALVKDLVPAGRVGRGFGMYNFVLGIAAIPAGLLTGGLWTLAGSEVALGVAGGFAACAAGALWVWTRAREWQPKPANP